MNTSQIVVHNSGAQERDSKLFNENNHPAFARGLANFFSYLFHPSVIPTLIIAYLLYIHPYVFAGFNNELKLMRLLSVIVSTFLLPVFSVFLLWRLRFIQSIKAHSQKERIYIYLISMIFYFWIWYVFKSLSDSPLIVKQFLLGAFLAVCGAWMSNIYFKISMHATAMGGLLMFFLLLTWNDENADPVYLCAALLISGLVGTSRLIVSNHKNLEIYTGMGVGMLAQVFGIWLT